MSRVEPKERKRIVALLKEHDGNRSKVAKLCGRSKGLISKIATQEGIESVNVHTTKKATEAHAAYAEERRLELIGKGFKKADELLKSIKDSGEFQKWTVGLGTLVDKARLETGDVTSRNESRHQHRNLDLSKISNEELEEFERIISSNGTPKGPNS